MRLNAWAFPALIVALAVGIPATAHAQTPSSAPKSVSAQSTAPDPATTAPRPASQAQSTSITTDESFGQESHWIASGFVGSNFGASASNSSLNFGGQVGYLYKNAVGAEFLADFTPNFKLQNNVLLGGLNPQVNSYMFNVIGALPLGAEARFQPYISGGVGAVTLRSDQLNTVNGNALQNTFNPDDTRVGGDIGGGIMAFAGNWGVRGDVRYFRAFNAGSTTLTGDASNIAAERILPGLDFWRANIGVAVRW